MPIDQHVSRRERLNVFFGFSIKHWRITITAPMAPEDFANDHTRACEPRDHPSKRMVGDVKQYRVCERHFRLWQIVVSHHKAMARHSLSRPRESMARHVNADVLLGIEALGQPSNAATELKNGVVADQPTQELREALALRPLLVARRDALQPTLRLPEL